MTSSTSRPAAVASSKRSFSFRHYKCITTSGIQTGGEHWISYKITVSFLKVTPQVSPTLTVPYAGSRQSCAVQRIKASPRFRPILGNSRTLPGGSATLTRRYSLPSTPMHAKRFTRLTNITCPAKLVRGDQFKKRLEDQERRKQAGNNHK